MSGVTDVPFRKLAHHYGAGLVVSEMVASEAFITGQEEMQLKVMSADFKPHMVQLAGREAGWMAKAAIVAEANGADIIDINMGCPAKRVTTGYSGSALMRDLDHALTLIDAVVGAVRVPVTLKMRLGWDDNSLNAPELAKRAEDAGVQMITVHGRTRCQFYKGQANWSAVRNVREVIKLPLVVNGDITDRTGIESGIRQARKHLGWYLDNLNLPASSGMLKKIIMTSFEPSEIYETLATLFAMHEKSQDTVQAA